MTWSPPTDEQLERFVCVMVGAEMRRNGLPPTGLPNLVREGLKSPALKEAWLRRHRELQEAADGKKATT